MQIRVKRVEQQAIKKSHPMYNIIDKHCFYSKNVYNQANYLTRQAFIKENKNLNAYEIQKIMQPMECYKECGSQAAQKTIQLVDKNWKSFLMGIKGWTRNPNKYLGKPKMPKYLSKNGRQIFVLKNIQCSLDSGIFRISYKPFKQYTVKTHANGKLLQCRFVPKGSHYVMEIVYEIEVPDCNDIFERIAAIDIGVDNFITMVNNIGEQPIIVKGGVIKSINQYYNKRKARLQSELKKINNRNWSKNLQKLTDKRYEMVKYQMHCISKKVIDYCMFYQINTLVVGHNNKWKQDNKGMQNFTYIPFDLFIKMLAYKCENVGIKFIQHEELYTSGTSFLDNEAPTKANYDKSRRVYRGLFISNNGVKINADVNGAYQIIKKVIPNAFSDGIEGVGLHPVQMKVIV